VSGIFSFVRFYGKREWALTVFVIALTFAQVWLDLELPRYMAAITDVITAHGTTAEVTDKAVGMALCAVGSLAVGLSISVLVGYISASVAKAIRAAEFLHVQSFSFAEVDRLSAYSLITRSTNDVKQVQDFIGTSMHALVRAPIISVWAVLRISSGNLTWTAATFTAIILMTALVLTVMHLTAPRFKIIQRMKDAINSITSEAVVGQRVIRAYNAEEHQNARFDRANEGLIENNLRVNHVMSLNVPFNGLIRNGLTLAIYWLGAFIIVGTSSESERLVLFSDMIVFATYATLTLNGFRSLVQIFNVFPRAKVSMDRIWEVLNTEPTIVGGEVTEGKERGTLSFRNVSFRYPLANADVLESVSFDVGSGETVAIIGATGCGKSTLAHLVPRFYDTTGGSILVDGVDVRDYSLDALRSRIGYVSQKAEVLRGSVRDNVNYGAGAENRTDDQIWEALQVACIDDFVERVGGLDVSLSEEGKNLSGGQKQRISIARAVCKRPEIYVFDDCFSALDFRTDREVRARLRKVTGGATSVIITQRIGTARGADRIIVLDGGTVVGQGTHRNLLDSCPLYREIAESQRTGDEI